MFIVNTKYVFAEGLGFEIQVLPQNRIQELKWSFPTPPQLQIRKNAQNQIEPFVRLEGQYQKEDYLLMNNNAGKTIATSSDGKFEIEQVIHSETELITLHAVGPKGDVSTETVEIRTPRYFALKQALEDETKQKRLFFSAGTGLTFLNYAQTNKPSHGEFLQSFKGSASYRLNEKWDFNANAFVNAITLSSNQSDSVKFFGANLRAGYSLLEAHGLWALTLNGGWYYVTTFGANVGFLDLSGPQIFPAVRYKITENKSAYGYLKYSPIADRLSLLSLTNREFAVGTGYTTEVFRQQVSVSLDFSMIDLKFTDNISIAAKTLSINLGINF